MALDEVAAYTIKSKGSYGKNLVHFLRHASYSESRPCKGIQDSLGFWIPHRKFQILCLWKLDPGFQSLEFRIPQQQFAGFRIPEAKVDLASTRREASKRN